MENITVKIGDRTIPLRFKMNQFIEIEEEVGNLGEVKELLLKGKNRVRNTVSVIRILGNAGLKHAGQEPDLTDEWLKDNMDPHALIAYQVAVIGCMSKETESEAATEEKENTSRDVVLDEINSKKDPVNLHTGE